MNLKRASLQIGIFLAANTLSLTAYSIESNTITIGNFGVVPSFDVDYSMNDNIFLSNNNKVQSNITILNPKIQTTYNKDSRQYIVTMEIFKGNYSESETDNYLDWNLSGETQFNINTISSIEVNSSFLSTHETRGTNFSEAGNLPEVPDEYDDFSIGAKYLIGNSSTLARAAIDFNYFNRGYNNNRFVTITRDRQEQTLGAAFFYPILSTSIEALLEFKHAAINYLHDPIFNTLDNDENFSFIGLQWTDLIKTSGSLKLGYGKKDFDSSFREDIAIPVWDADFHLALSNSSILSLNTKRNFDETQGIGSAIIDTSYKLDWQYNWSKRFNSVLQTSYHDNQFNDASREDDTYAVGLKLNFAFARWLDLSLALSSQERSSELATYDYQQNLISIGFEVGL